MESTLFVCIQHLTTTTVALFKALIEIGAQPAHIVLLGKYYSSSQSAIHALTQLGIQVQSSTPVLERGKFSIHFKNDVHQLWQSAREIIQNGMIKNIIVLDDGGHCLNQIPVDLYEKYPMAGIEQTTAGLSQLNTNQLPLPIILVALSAAKKELESPVIASAIAERIIEKLPPPNTVTCGVVGVGSIGKAMIKRLQLLGYPVLIRQHAAYRYPATRNTRKKYILLNRKCRYYLWMHWNRYFRKNCFKSIDYIK